MKPKFAKGQRIRVREAPPWDASCAGATGVVDEPLSDANAAGTGWEVGVELDIGGTPEMWSLDERYLEAVAPVLQPAPEEDRCLGPDGEWLDELHAFVSLHAGAPADELIAATVASLAPILGGRCVSARVDVGTDTMPGIGTAWCGARAIGEVVADLRTAMPGTWDGFDDGWRVYLDILDDPALSAFLGPHALALHIDHLPWSSPARRSELLGNAEGGATS